MTSEALDTVPKSQKRIMSQNYATEETSVVRMISNQIEWFLPNLKVTINKYLLSSMNSFVGPCLCHL